MASFNPEEENEQYGGAFSDTYSRDANGVVGSWQDAVANMDAQRYEQGARIVGYDSVGDVPMSVDDQRATRLALDEGNKTLSQQREEMSSELYPQNGEDSRSMYANYGAGGNRPQDWASIALRKQKQDSLEAALSRRQAEYDHIMQIRESARARMEKMNQSKAIAAAAGLMSMYESQNGMSDASLSSSLSEAFGQEFFGFQKLRGLTGDEEQFNGNVALVVPKYQNGMKKDTTVAGMMNMETQLQTLQRAMLGTRTLPMQRELWGQLTQKYTPEQLEAKGLHNPDGPYVVGSTTLRGGTARRLGPERHGISAFSADGKGGFTKTRWTPERGYEYPINEGTRADDYQGDWKTLRSGFISRGVDANGQSMGDYGSVMQNSKTGEIKFVPNGGELTKEQQAQESRLELQQMQNEGAVAAAEARSHNWDGKNNTATQQVLGKIYDTTLRQISNATDPKVKEDLQGQLESIRAAMTESGINFGDGSTGGTSQPSQKTGKSIVENALAGARQPQQNPSNASNTPISEGWVDFYGPDGKKRRAKGYVKNGVAYGADGKELGRTTNKPAAGGKTTPPPNKKEAVDPKNESAGDFSISKSARKSYKDDNRERAFKKFYQELISKEGMEDIPESAARERFDSYLERRKDPEGTVMKILDNGIESLGGTLDAMGKGIFGIGRK